MKSTSNQPLCIGLGEILRDMLPSGRQCGGEPANFAYHAQCLDDINQRANRIAAYVCGQPGATPPMPPA